MLRTDLTFWGRARAVLGSCLISYGPGFLVDEEHG